MALRRSFCDHPEGKHPPHVVRRSEGDYQCSGDPRDAEEYVRVVEGHARQAAAAGFAVTRDGWGRVAAIELAGVSILHWSNDPTGQDRALAFFRQHPKGVRTAVLRHTPGIAGKFVGDPGVPSTTHFVITTGDGVARWCSANKHWTWDGQRFAAELCTKECS